MTVIEFLKSIHLPDSREGGKTGRPSTGEIRRWLQQGAVILNGKRPRPWDKVEFPVRELVFFPKSPNKVTMVQEDHDS